MRVRQRLRTAPQRGPNQVVESGRVLNTRRKVFEIPQVPQRLEHRGCAVRGLLASHGVDAVVFNVALGRVRRDKPRRHAATQTVKGEGVVGTIGSSLNVGLVIRADGKRGLDVVVEAACFVEGEEEKGLVPLRACPDRVVDLLDQDLAEGDVAGRVHGVCVEVAAGGVDVGELREEAQVGVLVEVLNGDNAALCVLSGPIEEERVWEEVAVGAVIVLPGDAVLAGDLEDARYLDAGDVEAVVVFAVAV